MAESFGPEPSEGDERAADLSRLRQSIIDAADDVGWIAVFGELEALLEWTGEIMSSSGLSLVGAMGFKEAARHVRAAKLAFGPED